MSNYQTGHDAEKAAAQYMLSQGFKIIELNWRTKYCEIDIVAERQKTVFFTEVKYRKSTTFGSGLDYITPKKLKQMKFAAEFWVSERKWTGDYQLAAIEVSGSNFQNTRLLTDF